MTLLALCFVMLPGLQSGDRVVVVECDNLLRFSVTEINAKVGERLTIEFKNVARIPDLQNNLVILKPGTNVAQFTNEAMKATASEYIPQNMRDAVVAYTRIIDIGQSARLTVLLTEPGEYPYLSSLPGRAAISRGTLIVR